MEILRNNLIAKATRKESPVDFPGGVLGKSGGYDNELHMYKEPEAQFDVPSLRFLRWLAEHGQLEHSVAGKPAGSFAENANSLQKAEPQGGK